MFRSLSLFAALFTLLFLLALDLSSLFIYFNLNIFINSYIIIALTIVLSLIALSRIKRRCHLILLSLVAIILHMLSFYLLLPVGWAADQRTHYIDDIEKAGNIDVLKMYSSEGLNYVLYPVPWLNALFVKLILGIGSRTSWLLTVTTAFLCFLILLILIYSTLNQAVGNRRKTTSENFTWLILITTITIYLQNPFLNLIPSSFGLLSFALILYLLFSNLLNRKYASKTFIMIVISLPLLIAHGLSIYFSVAYLLLAAFSFVLQGYKEHARKALLLAFMVFAGTWLYQTTVQLVDALVREIPYRYEQLLESLKASLLERPLTSSVEEQSLRYVYTFDFIIASIAYALPFLLTVITTLFFMCMKIRNSNIRYIDTLLLYSFLAALSFLIAGYFGWKGLENAVARYIYVYTALISVIVNTLMLNFVFSDKKATPLKVLYLLVILIIGTIALTENFFTPYASIFNIPDPLKFKVLCIKYYMPGTLNRNLANGGLLKELVEVVSFKKAYVIPLYLDLANRSVIYSNGFYGIILQP